jgi:acyl-coenzyme A synthetase/AMP-(fatty) acid ligase
MKMDIFGNTGRADDLFKVNGRWLSPAEVERVLVAHPAEREAGVVAREDGPASSSRLRM